MGYVYVLEFPNWKRYVGQSKNPEKRCRSHLYKGKVREAMDQFGFVNVKKHTWEVPDSQMDDLERFLISVYRSDNAEFGYNTQTGGKSGYTYTQSEESRMKMSESHIGKSQSDTTRKKISNSLTGKSPSEESRMKMSEAHKGDKNTMYGKHQSDEARRKMSEARRLWWGNKKGTVP